MPPARIAYGSINTSCWQNLLKKEGGAVGRSPFSCRLLQRTLGTLGFLDEQPTRRLFLRAPVARLEQSRLVQGKSTTLSEWKIGEPALLQVLIEGEGNVRSERL